jgi:hypothetical protein
VKYIRKSLLLLLVLSPVAAIYLLPRSVKVEKLRCVNQYGRCNEDLIVKLDNIAGNNLYDARKEIKSLLTNDSTITNFSMQYKLPNILLVNVIDKDPKYAISNIDKKSLALVDSRGEVVGFTETKTLPSLEIDSILPNVGDIISEETHFALKLVYSVRLSSKLTEAKIEKGDLYIVLKNGVKLIFPTGGDVEVLMGSANLILSRLNVIGKDTKIDEKEKISVIDLRFDNPVVR